VRAVFCYNLLVHEHADHWATLPWLPDSESTVTQQRRPEPGYVTLAVVVHYR